MKVTLSIPVFNEERQLEESICALETFVRHQCRFDCEIVIADNGSTDRTLTIARGLEKRFSNVRVCHLDLKGRGRALKTVWKESAADCLSYMDVDLSTDLRSLPPLIDALEGGCFDLAIGTRLHPQSVTTRCPTREFISRVYIRMVRLLLGVRFSDTQCGFKAITRAAAQRLLPAVEDLGWFFDTELLVIAAKCGYRIHEEPVRWTEDADSRVRIMSAAWADLKGIWRVRRNLRRGAYDHLKRSGGDSKAVQESEAQPGPLIWGLTDI